MGRLATFLLLASLAGCLVLPAAAGAHASARTERLSVQAADAYWLQRGLSACPNPRIEYAALASAPPATRSSARPFPTPTA